MRLKRVRVVLSAAIVALGAALVAVGAPQGAPATVAPVSGGAAVTRPAVAKTRKTEQMRGFSLQMWVTPPKTEAEEVERYMQAIDDIADMGCTWINLPISGRQQDVHSETIYINWKIIPSQANLLRIMAKAKSRGMGVMMMPMVLLENSGSKDWRGIIDPPNWDNWFASYTSFITQMAALARAGDVDIFCVGSELLSTESFKERWTEVIKQIRKEFKGKLTYSANWDHYSSVTFWDQLDYVGMNNYNELAKVPGEKVETLIENWKPIKKNILEFAAKQKKPFMFTEVGWHNLVNTIPEPWNYVAQGKIDHDEQLHAYQSFVATWKDVPKDQFMGAFIWEWYPGQKPDDHGAYSLQGTEALKVVQEWFAMP